MQSRTHPPVIVPLHLERPETYDERAARVGTLYQWRYTGGGPKAYRLGKHLRYRQADVESWLADQVA